MQVSWPALSQQKLLIERLIYRTEAKQLEKIIHTEDSLGDLLPKIDRLLTEVPEASPLAQKQANSLLNLLEAIRFEAKIVSERFRSSQ
jgi:hypothetical protein